LEGVLAFLPTFSPHQKQTKKIFLFQKKKEKRKKKKEKRGKKCAYI